MTQRQLLFHRRLIGVAAAAALLAALAGLLWWVAIPQWRPELRPGESYGIDVSNHQGDIDWRAVAEDEITFAYVKATEGGDFLDQRFNKNVRDAKKAGLEVGAYHFFTLCRPGADQAANFLRNAPANSALLAPAVDLELGGNCAARPPADEVLAELSVFMNQVEAAWGRPMIVYTNDDFDDKYPVRALGRDLWEPTYYRRPSGTQWTIWQVTSLAYVDGVEGRVDLDLRRRTE